MYYQLPAGLGIVPVPQCGKIWVVLGEKEHQQILLGNQFVTWQSSFPLFYLCELKGKWGKNASPMGGKDLGRTTDLCMLLNTAGYKEVLNKRWMWWTKVVYRRPAWPFFLGNRRARWSFLGPGHLGAQGAPVIRVVDYCNEQIERNSPQRPMSCWSHSHLAFPHPAAPCCGAWCRGSCCFAAAWVSAQRRNQHSVMPRDSQSPGPSAPCWGGRILAAPRLGGQHCEAVRQQLGLPAGCADSRGAAQLLPAPLKGCGSIASAGALCIWPQIFLLHMHKAQCGVRGF